MTNMHKLQRVQNVLERVPAMVSQFHRPLPRSTPAASQTACHL